jgi:hypothetical protein
MPVQGFEDWDFWLSALEHDWQFAYVPRILFDYRVAKESMITRTAGREPEIRQFIMAKHIKMYSQVWFSMRDPSSFKAAARLTVELLGSKITERLSMIKGRSSG